MPGDDVRSPVCRQLDDLVATGERDPQPQPIGVDRDPVRAAGQEQPPRELELVAVDTSTGEAVVTGRTDGVLQLVTP